MAPPSSGAARRSSTAPQSRPSTRRPPLRVLHREPRRSARPGHSRRAHVWLAVVLVVGSLLAVVVGDTLVAQGQVRLADIQQAIWVTACCAKPTAPHPTAWWHRGSPSV